ncbi:MAG TPA: ABC transporter permease [Verrucomicrobiae bacterium]|nr:ABC transporter permease [Verrucomicrobiae bacterium]
MIRMLLHAARRLRRAPLFTVTSILTLAIGIGACALMMSLVSSILIKPLPYERPGQLEMVWGDYPDARLGFPEQPTHGAVFRIIRDTTRTFESIAAFRGTSLNLGDAINPERVNGVQATGEFFRTFGISPQIGRFFQRDNETPGADRVVVLSDALWRRRFGADPQIVGRTLTLNDEPSTVIGVAPRGFAFPRGAEMPGDFQFAAAADAWVPLDPPESGIADLAIVGRLREGTTPQGARQDMDRVMEVVQRTIPVIRNSRPREWLVPLRQQVVGDVTPMLASLLAGVLLVLVVACVNTSQLVLAQLQARRHELAVRSALGATTRRLAGEVLVEVALLVAAGGALGIFAANEGLNLLRAYGSRQLPRVSELAFDTRSALAALGVMAAAALVVTLVPVLLGGRARLLDVLRRGGRGSAQSGIPFRARRALIVCELAGALVLLTSAGLLVRDLSRQLSAKLGFDTIHGVTFEVSLPPIRYPERPFATGMEHAAGVQFLTSALGNIRALPGVAAAGIGKPLPLSGAQQASTFTPEGQMPPIGPDAAAPIAQFTVASPGMIRALGAPMLAGRDFSDDDRADNLPVVIVNESMAKWLWPGESAIGKRLRLGRPLETRNWPWMTVVGVVSDMKRYALTETPRPEMIVPYTQNPYMTYGTMQFIVRSSLGPALLREVQGAIAAADPTIPIANARTVDDLVSASASNARFVARFMAGFGLVALVLTVVGIYGVIGYGVQRRRQEFGVRRAIGAGPREILALVLREAIRLTVAGIAVGLPLTLAAGFGLRHLLFDISPYDPISLAGSIAVLVVATIAASVIPAIAAARIGPRVALED